jgi:hypothetical protein
MIYNDEIQCPVNVQTLGDLLDNLPPLFEKGCLRLPVVIVEAIFVVGQEVSVTFDNVIQVVADVDLLHDNFQAAFFKREASDNFDEY